MVRSRKIAFFRKQRTAIALPPEEKRLLLILSVHVCFLPWALGTMHPWSQWVSLGLGLLGLVVALLPRAVKNIGVPGEEPAPRSRMWPRLFRFPLFWAGLLLLGYIAVQALNPSWRYTRNETSWWLVKVPNIAWLPTSIDAPFKQANAWRQFIIYAAAWLVTCSSWIGLTRRRSLRILLGVLTMNALVLGVLLAVQRTTGNPSLFWPLTEFTARSDLTASFVYRNHSAAYLGLLVFAPIALAIWSSDEGARALQKSTPAPVFALAAGFLAGCVLFTMSRGGSLALVVSVLAFAIWLFARTRRRAAKIELRTSLALAILFSVFALYVGRNLHFSDIHSRFKGMLVGRAADPSVWSRLEARSAGYDLLAHCGQRGLGAGGFRYLFPEYVRKYPEIYQNGRLFWEHLHNDWLEVSIELGRAGMVLLAGGGLYWVVLFIRRRALWYASSVPLLFGCTGTLFHAWYDFPFQCPAILVTWCLFLALVGRHLEFEAIRRRSEDTE